MIVNLLQRYRLLLTTTLLSTLLLRLCNRLGIFGLPPALSGAMFINSTVVAVHWCKIGSRSSCQASLLTALSWSTIASTLWLSRRLSLGMLNRWRSLHHMEYGCYH